MESNALMFVDITKDFREDSSSDDYFSPIPHHFRPRPPRPPFHDNNYYKVSAIVVLCLGTLALIIICWKCCRNKIKKESRGTVHTATTPATPSSENVGYETSAIPMPPPYMPPEYEKPPPYSLHDAYVSQKNANPPKYIKPLKTDVENTGQTSQPSGTATATVDNVHVVNIYDPKT